MFLNRCLTYFKEQSALMLSSHYRTLSPRLIHPASCKTHFLFHPQYLTYLFVFHADTLNSDLVTATHVFVLGLHKFMFFFALALCVTLHYVMAPNLRYDFTTGLTISLHLNEFGNKNSNKIIMVSVVKNKQSKQAAFSSSAHLRESIWKIITVSLPERRGKPKARLRGVRP